MRPAQVTARAPASVSNVACGFDVLGFALESPGDEVVATVRGDGVVSVERIDGDGERLPRDAKANTASVAVSHLLKETGSSTGVALTIRKGIPLASGLGSSAASAVAAVVAVDAALGLKAPTALLIRSAIEAERLVASGSPHGDNVAPSLLGGFVLLHGDPASPHVVRLPVPKGLACAVVHPHHEVTTSAARAVLGDVVALKTAVGQWGRLGALVSGLYDGNLDRIAQALVDEVAEPKRAHLIPGFAAMKRAALDAGALGCSISGAGPSVFALCRTRADAERVGASMNRALERDAGLAGDVIASSLEAAGARVV